MNGAFIVMELMEIPVVSFPCHFLAFVTSTPQSLKSPFLDVKYRRENKANKRRVHKGVTSATSMFIHQSKGHLTKDPSDSARMRNVGRSHAYLNVGN